MTHDWIQDNVDAKDQGLELLTLTAHGQERLQSTWLQPKTGEQTHFTHDVLAGHFPSLSRALPEVSWDEREIQDLFGYVADNHPDPRALIRTPRWPEGYYPLAQPDIRPAWQDTEPDRAQRTVQGEGITIMKVGPTHAGIIESGHFIFSLMGENVLYLDAHLFQNHRGLEALLERQPISDVAPLVTRTCAADTVSHQTNWAMAIEAMAGFVAPSALTDQRILLLESERVLSHLNDLAQIPAGVGLQVAHQRGLAMKEQWQQHLQQMFGHRFLFDTVLPGWTKGADSNQVLLTLNQLRELWAPWRRLVEGHHGFHDRMRGVGHTSHDQIIRWGAQGVAARASGKRFDARETLPWYADYRLEPMVETSGDVQARFQLRLNELEESFRLIEMAALRLKRDPYAGIPLQFPLDITGHAVTFTESPHGLNTHDVTVEHGHIVRYHIRAATYRNWPVLAQAVANNALADFPLINKSFELCYSCTDR